MARRVRGLLGLAGLVCCFLLPIPMLPPLLGQEDSQQTAQTPPEKPKPLVIPPSEKARKNPLPNTPEVVESGRGLYTSQCAMCHGVKGDGKGDLVQRLKLAVPDLTDPGLQRKRTDGDWFYILSKGHADMPPENRLEDNAKWEMISYIRTLSREPKGAQ
jgi:mono/diheme cytochrome c family protein